MSPLQVPASPDSSNSEFSGRITPKMFITKAFSSMTSSPLSTHSFENDSPSPSAALPSSSASSTSSSSSKDSQERMEVASCGSSGDSGVDVGSDIGSSCELTSTDGANDSLHKQHHHESKEREDMVVEEEVSASNIPMTL